MARLKKAGKGAAVITLLSNPIVRQAAIKAATRAANSASTYIAARNQNKKAPPSPAPSGGPQPIRVESETRVVSGNSNPSQEKPAAKPSSFADSAAVESIVSTIAGAAKPVAEKMASTDAGRSVLQAINNLSSQALGSSSGPPKKAGAAVASFVGSILAGQAAQKSQASPRDSGGDKGPKFQAVKPPPPEDPPPVQTMQWPPKQ